MTRALAAVALGLVAAGCGGDPSASEGGDALAQHEVTARGDLLTPGGELREPGWATTDLQRWNPEQVADPTKLRQWDFFTIANADVAVNITLADVSYQIGSVGVVDMATGATASSTAVASPETLTLSSALGRDATLLSDAGAPQIAFAPAGADTQITIDIATPFFSDPAKGSLTIHRRPEMPFLSLATPFAGDPHQFFYEQKIPGLTAEGTLTVGDQTWNFAAADTIAVMDWGRGQWPAKVHWQWASGSGRVEGERFAFNLGSVFGDDTSGTENIVFFADEPTKLGRVTWTHDEADLLADWTFQDDEGALSLVLHPVAPETSDIVLGTQDSHVRKAYGGFSGTVTLGSGRVLHVDSVLGAAEEEHADW